MRTASHCLWLGKNPGRAVNRKDCLLCPHHQVLCLGFIWKPF